MNNERRINHSLSNIAWKMCSYDVRGKEVYDVTDTTDVAQTHRYIQCPGATYVYADDEIRHENDFKKCEKPSGYATRNKRSHVSFRRTLPEDKDTSWRIALDGFSKARCTEHLKSCYHFRVYRKPREGDTAEKVNTTKRDSNTRPHDYESCALPQRRNTFQNLVHVKTDQWSWRRLVHSHNITNDTQTSINHCILHLAHEHHTSRLCCTRRSHHTCCNCSWDLEFLHI